MTPLHKVSRLRRPLDAHWKMQWQYPIHRFSDFDGPVWSIRTELRVALLEQE